MLYKEIQLICSLASIFALRMLGLCMLLPVFAVAAKDFTGATPQLVGIAVGAYGLSQAVLQIPFGLLSDKFGRRPLLLLGLGLLFMGSLVAYYASSIYGLILGRILQGTGAIGSVIIATLADFTREQVRARAMAVIGISIGAAFVIAFILGPWLTQRFGLQSLFMFTASMAVLGIGLVFITIPKSPTRQAALDMASLNCSWRALLTDQKLLTLNYGIFASHAILAALFLVLPLIVQQAGFNTSKVWQLYLQALLISLPLALAFIARAEKHSKVWQLQNYALMGLLLTLVMLQVLHSAKSILVILAIFFTAFCILEAILPTLIAKYAPAAQRGAAMGVYSSLQFLGVFLGGAIGGWLHAKFGINSVLQLCMLLAVVWIFISLRVFRLRVKKWQEA